MHALALMLAREDPASVIGQILATAGPAFDADRAWLIRFNHDHSLYWIAHEWCADGVDACLPEIPAVPVTLIADPMVRFLKGEPAVYADIEDLPGSSQGLKEELRREGIRAIAGVPLFSEGHLVALVGLDDVRRPHAWTSEEMALLRQVGEILLAADQRQLAANRSTEPLAAPEATESPDGCYLRSGNCHVQVRWNEILWLRAEGDYTRLHLRNGREFYERRTLRAWDAVLPAQGFGQVHRSWIVNWSCLRQLHRSRGGKWSLLLSPEGEAIPIGRRFQQAVRERLNLTTVSSAG